MMLMLSDSSIYPGYHRIFCIAYPRISQRRPFRVSILHLCMILYKYLLYIVRGGVQIPALQVREGSKYLLYRCPGVQTPWPGRHPDPVLSRPGGVWEGGVPDPLLELLTESASPARPGPRT